VAKKGHENKAPLVLWWTYIEMIELLFGRVKNKNGQRMNRLMGSIWGFLYNHSDVVEDYDSITYFIDNMFSVAAAVSHHFEKGQYLMREQEIDELRRFASNTTAIIESLPEEIRAAARALLNKDEVKRLFDHVETAGTEVPFVLLPPNQLYAYRKQAAKFQWDDRQNIINPETGEAWRYHTNAFEFLRVHFRKWLRTTEEADLLKPGLTREDIGEGDDSLHAHLKRKISLEGLPSWLDLPTGAQARLRAITDPLERIKLQGRREYNQRLGEQFRKRHRLGD
jgi:hypothetical protein